MGIVYEATLDPSKQELVAGWLPSRPWGQGLEISTKVGEYRLDDPAGEVGVETIVFATTDGSLIQVPLTYRSEPLEGAEAFLVGTSEHSVLGRRWVYDGCGDPIWAAGLATAILTGAAQDQMFFERDGERIDVPPRMQVHGSGEPGADVPTVAAVDSATDHGTTTVVRCGALELLLARVLGTELVADETLTGTWKGGEGVLASLRRTS